jgi:lysophospholipase L1-like esterase
MLGTNDVKKRFSAAAGDIAAGAGMLVDIINKSGSGRSLTAPKVLLMAPPPLGKLTELKEMFEGGQEKSLKFSKYYKTVAETYGAEFFDTSTVIKSSDIDGIHLEKDAHQKLGQAVAKQVKKMIPVTDSSGKSEKGKGTAAKKFRY